MYIHCYMSKATYIYPTVVAIDRSPKATTSSHHELAAPEMGSRSPTCFIKEVEISTS